MNTFVCNSSPLCLTISSQSPRKPAINSPTDLPSIKNMQNLSNPSKERTMRASSKGFTGVPPTTIPEEATKRQNSNKSNDDDEEIPPEVFERMMVRIVASVGVPMAIGLGVMHLFGALREQHLWDAPKWVLFLSLFLTFGASALGIAYGALSTSLDVNNKGSFLGFDEVLHNWGQMWKEEDKKNVGS